MGYNPKEALREAGWGLGNTNEAADEVLNSLTKEQTEFLISFNKRMQAAASEVQAHEWTAPEATQQGFDAAMLCMCGVWSGSGEALN